MSPFEVVQAIQSAGVGVVGLDLRRTVVVLRSVEHQDIGETVVIRFRCVSQPNRNIRRVPRGETETPPSDFLRGRTYPYWRWMYGACLPRGPVTRRTYKQSWISTAAAPPPPPGSWIWNPKPRMEETMYQRLRGRSIARHADRSNNPSGRHWPRPNGYARRRYASAAAAAVDIVLNKRTKLC
jgi:hypothetical protein